MREIALATGSQPTTELFDAADLDTGGFSIVHLSSENPAAGILAIETFRATA